MLIFIFEYTSYIRIVYLKKNLIFDLRGCWSVVHGPDRKESKLDGITWHRGPPLLSRSGGRVCPGFLRSRNLITDEVEVARAHSRK